MRSISRIVFKIFIGPFKYKGKGSYRAYDYWKDRFMRYGLSLKGSGDEGLSEEGNRAIYRKEEIILKEIFSRKSPSSFSKIGVLDIGCGTGYYSEFFQKLGVEHYTGIDITDILFAKLKPAFPKYRFLKKDITKDTIPGKFDLIIMINVLQHIVTRKKLRLALQTIKNCLNRKGLIVLGPIIKGRKLTLFYERYWSVAEIGSHFPGYNIERKPFYNNSDLLIIQKEIEK